MKEIRTCKIENCTLPIRAKGMCNGHYVRWRKGLRGDELTAPVRPYGRPVPHTEGSYRIGRPVPHTESSEDHG